MTDERTNVGRFAASRVVHHLHSIKQLALATLALAAVAVPLAFGLLHAPCARAQQSAPATASFDVTSVKLLQGIPNNLSMSRSGGRIRWNTTIMGMVMYAYRIQAFQETGMAHVPYNFYSINAETNPDATDDRIRLMFQSLLAGRFKFQSHRETRELSGYSLMPAKGGVKIKPTPPDAPPAPLPEWFAHGGDAMSKAIEGKILATAEGRGITAITGRRITIAQLVQALEDQLRAPIHDPTGLTGQYYFGFKSIRVDAPPDADANSAILAPTLFDALRESLGLQLEKRTVPVDMLIVDHVEKSPTEN